MGQKFLSSMLVVLFALPQLTFGSADFSTKEKAVVKAYKRVSISLASKEFNDVQREQYLEAFGDTLKANEVTKEEFEKIALENSWVPENFDFSKLWDFVKDVNQERVTKADGSYDLEALKTMAAKGKQFFSGQTGNQWASVEIGENLAHFLIIAVIAAAVAVVAVNS